MGPIDQQHQGMPMKLARVLCAGIALGLTAAYSASAQRATASDVQERADGRASAYNKHDRAALGAVYSDGAGAISGTTGPSRFPDTAHDRRLEWAGIINSSLETQR
jgi:hypothetical protein